MERNTMDQIAGEGGLQDPMDKATGQEKDQMVLEEDHQDLNGEKMVQAQDQERGLDREIGMVQMGKDQERDQTGRE